MFKASHGIVLPTSIIGSLPRPAWFTVSIGHCAVFSSAWSIHVFASNTKMQ